ncbi:MAG: hypothetical protein H7039_12305, partial [Bryobacteraceae bacterium]|nr:hypothetical protein [Bryobacteraceae bacterium]
MSPNEWVPIRWSSGPLDADSRTTESEREALGALHRPAALDLLTGTPFNCLVLSFATGKEQDAEQQKTLAPLIEEAKRRQFTVLGRIIGPAETYLSAARTAGLDGVITDAPVANSPLPAFAVTGAASLEDSQSILPVKGCEWPAVRLSRSGNAESGPTGYPWVNANGWRIQLARTLHPSATVWSMAEPRKAQVPVRPELYALAVADAAAYGGRWLVTLDSHTQTGLVKQSTEAREAWATLVKAVRFFELRRKVSTEVITRFGILSTFAGENEAVAQESLNLSFRRQFPARILHPSRLGNKWSNGLRAIAVIGNETDRNVLQPALDAGATVLA